MVYCNVHCDVTITLKNYAGLPTLGQYTLSLIPADPAS